MKHFFHFNIAIERLKNFEHVSTYWDPCGPRHPYLFRMKNRIL